MERRYWDSLVEVFESGVDENVWGVLQRNLRQHRQTNFESDLGIVRMTPLGRGAFGSVWKVLLLEPPKRLTCM
jgi:hypothetical protein